VFDFLRLVWAVDQGLQSTSKRMEATLGVTGPQRLVLRLVGRFPGITPGQLAETLRVHPSTLSGVLKRLELRRLVARRKDPQDGRRCFLGLTEPGRALDVSAPGTVEAAVAQVLEAVPRERIDAAAEVLLALAEALRGDRKPQT
jgi:DNA-binding MarR family transcriptional regulator